MNLLCFDISSGGISAALFNAGLESTRVAENEWKLETDESGAATLSVTDILERFTSTIRALKISAESRIDAICISTFMHNLVLLDEADQPLTPLFTWLDRRGEIGMELVRNRLGDRFHLLTGCRYHSMFPVFKLAAIRLSDPVLLDRAQRAVSIKALLIHELTGSWIEDHGMASSSGLLNVTNGGWDSEISNILELDAELFPAITGRTAVAGYAEGRATARFGLPRGVPVIAGSGDGFLASLGSDCEEPSRIAVTLGTSAVTRQTLDHAVLDSDAGTFCYRADEASFILGCAGSNGGNVLDWAAEVLTCPTETEAGVEPPIFIPTLHGERSPDWDPQLRASWHGLTARHTAADLRRSVLEGVIFNLAHFVEIVQQTSGQKAAGLVLSGNGFLQLSSASILAGIAQVPVWMPSHPGLATLRGAGICALRALNQPVPPLHFKLVAPEPDSKIRDRYAEYRRLRARIRTFV